MNHIILNRSSKSVKEIAYQPTKFIFDLAKKLSLYWFNPIRSESPIIINVARGIGVKAWSMLYLKKPPKGEIKNPTNNTALQIIQFIKANFLTSEEDVSI